MKSSAQSVLQIRRAGPSWSDVQTFGVVSAASCLQTLHPGPTTSITGTSQGLGVEVLGVIRLP